jgi:hypothetical protein
MVCIGDRGNRQKDQHEWQPRLPMGSQILPQEWPEQNVFAKIAQLRPLRFPDGKM